MNIEILKVFKQLESLMDDDIKEKRLLFKVILMFFETIESPALYPDFSKACDEFLDYTEKQIIKNFN